MAERGGVRGLPGFGGLACPLCGAGGRQKRSAACPRYRLELPLPPKTLTANGRSHYLARARDGSKYRQLTRDIAIGWSTGAIRGLAGIRYVWRFRSARRRDYDNLMFWMKFGLDGIRDSGILADDDTSSLVHFPQLVLVDRSADEGVTVELYDLKEGTK